MDLNRIDSIELITTEREAGLNGAPSSQDYNDTMREMLTDLSSIADTLNSSVLPYLNTLPATVTQTLDGDGMYASHDTANELFVDSTTGSQLVISDVFARLDARVSAVKAQIVDLTARIAALQSRLATTQQNDVARAIQGFNDSLVALTNRVSNLEHA
jgi:hypothetical protein